MGGYTDPGALSLIISLVVAAVLAVPGFFFVAKYKVKEKIRRFIDGKRKR